MKKGRARKSSSPKKTAKAKARKSAPLKKAVPKTRTRVLISLVKKKIKKILPKRTVSKPVLTAAAIGESKKKQTASARATYDFNQMVVTKNKKPAPQASKKNAPVSLKTPALPYSYDETRLGLLVRDTHWGYTYWDFSGATWNWIQSMLQRDSRTRTVLRIHNLDAKTFFDLNISLDAKSWYIDFGRPNTPYQAELGLIDSLGKFYRIALSNIVGTPKNVPSSVIDPNWDSSNFDEIYALSGGGQTGHGSELFSRMKNIS